MCLHELRRRWDTADHRDESLTLNQTLMLSTRAQPLDVVMRAGCWMEGLKED